MNPQGATDRNGARLAPGDPVADAEDRAWHGRVAWFRADGEVMVRRNGKDYVCDSNWLVLITEPRERP